jgi:hypothetical protein
MVMMGLADLNSTCGVGEGMERMKGEGDKVR